MTLQQIEDRQLGRATYAPVEASPAPFSRDPTVLASSVFEYLPFAPYDKPPLLFGYREYTFVKHPSASTIACHSRVLGAGFLVVRCFVAELCLVPTSKLGSKALLTR